MKTSIKYCSAVCRAFALALALVLLVCGVGVQAHAETLTADLLVLDSDMNLAIAVTYTDDGTGTVPQLAFIAPDGTVFQQGITPEDQMTVEQIDNTICFYIPDARAGGWEIQYDDSFSGRLEVTTAPYARDLYVEQFVINEIQNDHAAVSLLASFPVNKELDFVINAVTLDSDGTVMGTKELYTGYGYTNEVINAYVPLDDLGSYTDYRLQLLVYVDEYGIEVSGSAMTDPFGYVNPNTPDMMGDFNIILNRSTGDLQIDWSNVTVWNAESYILAVYSSKDDSEPVYSNTYTADVTNAALLVDATADWLRVELSYAHSGVGIVSQTKAVTIEPNAVEFEVTTGEFTSAAQAEVSYNVPSGEVELYVFVHDDENNKPIKVSGSGTLAVNIEDNENTLYVAYKPSDYVVILESKDIFVDRKAPILTFFEDLSAITTNEAVFRVVGMTEAGAVLSVNGSAVQINADGSFMLELNLVPGANSFEIVSADPAGNLSRRTVLINRSNVAAAVGSDDVQPFWKTWLPLFIAVGASLAFAIFVMILFGGKKKLAAAQLLRRWSILAWVLSAAGLGVSVWLLVEKIMASNVVNTTEFFEKVKISIDEAYQALMNLQFYDQWFLIGLVVTVVLVVISIGLTVAAIIAGKNQNKPPKAPKEPKPPKPPKAAKQKKAKPEPVVAPAPAPVAEPEPVVAPAPVPVAEPEPEVAPAPVPVAEPEPEVTPAPVPVAEPEPEVVPAPVPVAEPEPEVAPAPAPVAEPEPVVAPAPVPVAEPEPEVTPAPVPVAEPAPVVRPVTPKFCCNCGSRCVEGAVFCVNCGHKLR